MNSHLQPETESQRGATLIELLAGVIVTGIILSALTGAFMTYFRAADGIRYLMNETPELQLAATRFASDVQSAAAVSTTGTTAACGGALAVGWAKVVDLAWNDPGAAVDTTDDRVVAVSYTYGAATHELRRTACHNGTQVEQKALVTHLAPAGSPTMQCDLASCAGATPRQVDLGFFVCTTGSSGACLDSTIPATLTGVRRMSL
jgi:hypothetical protein